MVTWDSDLPPPSEGKIGPIGWALVLVRGTILGAITFGCLALLLIVRLFERPVFGARRPVTPYITRFVCQSAFLILGIKRRVHGAPMPQKGGYVANHSSWLDIFTLNASKNIYFVSKAEVAAWPGIGWLARATGTVFIQRQRKEAKAQTGLFQKRLMMGHQLLFFPEGTSSDGQRVLPFKTTLFAAFFQPELVDKIWIQPVSVVYTAPKGADARFYGWWGDMGFGTHFLKTLAAFPQGRVDVTYHAPLRVADFSDRKALAAACEDSVKSGCASAPL